MDAANRILELKKQGLSYARIAEILNSEGHRNSRGGEWNRTSVQQRVFQVQRQDKPAETTNSQDTVLHRETTKSVTQESYMVTQPDRDRLLNQERAVRQAQGIVTQGDPPEESEHLVTQEDHSVLQAGESATITQCETPEDVTQPQDAVLQEPPEESKPTYAQDSVLQANIPEDVTHEEHTVRQEQSVIQVQDTVRQAPREAVLQDNTGVTHGEMLDFLHEHKGSLVELLNAWEQRKELIMEDLTERPRFNRAGGTVTKTIRLAKTLVEDAERLAEKQRAITGGSFSGLVELLLWRYLGSDPRYVRTEGEARRMIDAS